MGKLTDVIFVEMKSKNGKRVIIGNIYRSPNNNDESNKKLNDLIKSLDRTRSMDLIVLGDFNYPEINWKISTCDKPTENPAFMFLEATRDAYLIQHIKEPTHARINENGNILELVFTNKEGLVEDCTIGPPLGKSDHATINFSLKLKCNTPRMHQNRFQYDKGDYNSLRREIASIEWKSKFEGKNANEQWTTFQSEIVELCNKFIPKYKSTSKGRTLQMWMDSETLTKIRKKHQSYERWLQTKSGVDYQNYCKYRNQATRAIRKAVANFEKEIAKNMKVNPKMFWKYTKTRTKFSEKVAELDIPGGRVSSDKEKASTLNDAFTSIFTKEAKSDVPILEINEFEFSLDDIEINIDCCND